MDRVEDKLEKVEKEMQERSFAFDLLTEFKKANKRQFIIILILIGMLVVTNMAWLFVFQSYDFVSYESISENGGNANILHGDGDINNGEGKVEDKNEKK